MKRIISGFSYSVALCLLLCNPVSAQIESDRTLPINSNIIKNGINFKINGGTARGNNLFHSFKKFNIPTGGEAFFNNAVSIENIFTRVTGGSISNIDGIIKANGSANLFLMNPNGIIFGENAKLNIGGSFFGTTAENIKFTEGEFSAINPQAPPLLTINVPVGLQMGTNPGKIEVTGSGHNLITQDINFAPYINPGSSSLLKVEPGKTLALIGGDITLDGATLNAATGKVELSSVKNGVVNLNQTVEDFTLNIPQNSTLGNIRLSQQSLIDVSGEGAGEIQVNGNSVRLEDGSVLLVQNRGLRSAGDINVNATESLEVNGISTDGKIRSGIINETVAGNSGNINVITPRLIIQDGAGIGAKTFSPAQGGNVTLNVSESIDIGGISEINPAVFSAIGSTSFAEGKSGDISIETRNLSVADGATVAATSFGSGDGGNISIKNAQIVKVKGSGVGLFTISTIASSTYGKGNGGNININTENLTISEEANINTSSNNSGNAGNIAIEATEAVRVIDGTSLGSNVVLANQLFQSLFNLPKVPNGNGGNVTINTPFLSIQGNSKVTATNKGFGDAGIIKINANSILVNDTGLITAITVSGEGGNISLNTQSLQMRRGSNINTSAGGTGNGGNITIDTDTLVALENSDITANAENNFAGKVTINAQGIFGTQKREKVTNQSDITASSDLGASFSGVVELNTPGIDPNSGVNELPTNVIDTSNQIASGCLAQDGNTFVITGRGGIPHNPSQNLNFDRSWYDLRDFSAHRNQSDNITQTPALKPRKIVEATTWIRNSQGEIEFVALNSPVRVPQIATC
ncbi:MAG: filamentous hemagglutinin N-terminal domain-containing protein [Rivularia sp. (in: cyanobacteria)]